MRMTIEEAAMNFEKMLTAIREGNTVELTEYGVPLVVVTKAPPIDYAAMDRKLAEYHEKRGDDDSFARDMEEIAHRSTS